MDCFLSSSSVVLNDKSEYGVVVRLSISRLQQVFLNVQRLGRPENCPAIGRFLSRLQFCPELRHGGTMLGVPVAAGSDDGVSADQGETSLKSQWGEHIHYLHQRSVSLTACWSRRKAVSGASPSGGTGGVRWPGAERTVGHLHGTGRAHDIPANSNFFHLTLYLQEEKHPPSVTIS